MRSTFVGTLLAATLAIACNKSFSFTGGTTPSSSGDSSSSSNPVAAIGRDAPFAATATTGPAAWKKYDVRGIQLGMSRKDLLAKGFTCGPRANSRCYKVMDPRCDKASCKLREDAFGQWFELDGVKTELDYMSCATTESDAALIYEIRLVFGPRQLLAPDSTLGKALIAKYGGSTRAEEGAKEDKVGGGRMLWWNDAVGSNGPDVIVECNGTNMEGPQCTLVAEDGGVRTMERSRQEDIDAKRKHDNQPKTAPAL